MNSQVLHPYSVNNTLQQTQQAPSSQRYSISSTNKLQPYSQINNLQQQTQINSPSQQFISKLNQDGDSYPFKESKENVPFLPSMPNLVNRGDGIGQYSHSNPFVLSQYQSKQNENSYSFSFPFSTPDVDDNNKHPMSNFQSQKIEMISNNNTTNLQNISTIQLKSASYSSSNGSGFSNLQGVVKRSQGEGVKEGQDERQRLFSQINKEEISNFFISKVIVQDLTPESIMNTEKEPREQLTLNQNNNQIGIQHNFGNNYAEQSFQNNERVNDFVNFNFGKEQQMENGLQFSQIQLQSQQQNQLNLLLGQSNSFNINNQNNMVSNSWIRDDIDERTFKTAGGTIKTIRTGGTNAYTTVSKKQRDLWKKKWMILSLYIAKSVRSFKRILIFLSPDYLTKQQFKLINDKSACLDNLKEGTQNRYKGWLYSQGTIVPRKIKKRILIWIKKTKGVANFVRGCFESMIKCVTYLDIRYPPLSPLLPALQIFDLLIFLLIIFDFFFIPLYLCFNNFHGQNSNIIEIQHINDSDASLVFQKISVCAIIVDIIKQLNTCNFERGQLIYKRFKIIKHYFTERFLIDIISLFSLLIYSQTNNHLLLLIFYVRLIKISSVIGRLRECFLLKDNINSFINLALLVSFLYFFTHVYASFFYYLSVNQQLYNDEISWVINSGIQQSSLYVKYLFSFNLAISSFTPIDSPVLPTTQTEKSYVLLMNVFTCFLLPYLTHEAALILDSLSRKRRDYLKQLKQISKYMDDNHVSEYYQSLARKYLQYVSNEGLDAKQVNHEKTLSGLSAQLRQQIVQNSYLPRLKMIRVFNQYFSEQFLEKLSMKMNEQVLAPDEYILNVNRKHKPSIFIVKKGSIESCVNIGTQRTDKKDSLKTFKLFKEDMYFGAFEFFSHNYKPHLSARSVGVSVVQYLTLTDFLDLLEEFPEEKEAYTYIKEMVTIYNQLDVIGVSCYSCGERNHQALCCPYLFYDQQSAAIMKKIDQNQHQKIRGFKRKILEKTNTLRDYGKVIQAQEHFVLDNNSWLCSQDSIKSLELEENLQLNNIDIPKMDSQGLDSYYNARAKASSACTLGTFRVREEKAPGDINGIYFDSELDSNSAFLKYMNNSKQISDEHELGVMINQSTSQISSTQLNPSAFIINNSGQLLNHNALLPMTASIHTSLLDEDYSHNLNLNSPWKIHNKITLSPGRTAINSIPIKYRSKSTHQKPSSGDSLLEESNSLLDLKSINVKSPQANTVIINAQKPEQSSLIRRNTTKTRNRVQSFNLDSNKNRENSLSWRKPIEYSIFSQQKLDSNLKAEKDISEEDSTYSEEEEKNKNVNNQKSFSLKENNHSDKQSKRSDKQASNSLENNLNHENNHNRNNMSLTQIINNFSAVHSFRTFFPHNNVEHVLEVLNKKNKQARRNRQKVPKKSTHRVTKSFSKKRQSHPMISE